MTYRPPVDEMRFALRAIADFDALQQLAAFADANNEIVDSVLDEAARFARDVLAPVNRAGDEHPAELKGHDVKTSPGFREAYAQFRDAGWNGIAGSPDYEGQGLPHALGVAVQEMWQGANLSFGLCPILTQGVIDALTLHGTDEQKKTYLPKLISGEWTGTMNLTEPQAGSDVGALKSRAVKADDGSYRITGTKIFITWGEHDCAANIIHLILARLPDAPPGTRGISLFLVPKFLPNADGSPGARNDLACTGLEHKLGIHGSPTCVMTYGENGGATGFLVGAENKGMAAMFTMMNAARLNVGIQGVGVAEAAFQKALEYARERKQGKPLGLQHEAVDMVPILQHPDVRRMLLTMKALTEASRAICYANAVAVDLARHHPDADARAKAKTREELLTPISKGWSTDNGVTVASLGVQVHGGMGFIEETGAAQFYRDARILPIYEGTNGIQAIDLVTRKLTLEGGETVRRFIAEIVANADALQGDLADMGGALKQAAATLDEATRWLQDALKSNRASRALAGATPYLDLFGRVAGAHFLAKGALAASRENDSFHAERIAVARFFAANILPAADGLKAAVMQGGEEILDRFPASFSQA
ncbi:MAG TPA: acyl-CoA dehydrogenase [Rhizomicrobium sp.]|jgi:alkylation response protein AidB-like acyl-CoA dehydrogenase|nr:acyl-CoA dehydrogenase [Rhizomicrobium sp.]